MSGCGQSPPFSLWDGLGNEAVTGRGKLTFLRDRKGWKRRGKLVLDVRRMFAAKRGRDEARLVKGRVCHGWINVEGFA